MDRDIAMTILEFPENIETAYKSLCKKYHPDSRSPEADEHKFCEVTDAYKFLVQLESLEKHTQNVEPVQTDSLQSPLVDIIYKLPLTLSETCHGCTKTIIIIRKVWNMVTGDYDFIETTFNISAEPGVPDGLMFTYKGEGHVDSIGNRSDVHIIINRIPDALYTIKGYDLYREIPITLSEALYGGIYGDKFIDHLGKQICIKTQLQYSKQVNKIDLLGIPHYGSIGAGDLYLSFNIDMIA